MNLGEFTLHFSFTKPLVIEVHTISTAEPSAVLLRIEERVNTLLNNMATQAEIIASLQEGLAEVKANTDLIPSINVAFDVLHQELADALKEAGASEEVLAAAKAVIDAAKTQNAAIVASINANTPHATQNDVDASAHIGDPAATPPVEPAPVELPVADAAA